jgi:four helix bundle protein
MTRFAKSFRDLEVYQNALALALDVHQMSKTFPADERFVLADQMRRASRSVCGNISEAWRKRRYKAAFVSKLSDSETEASEMQCWLDMGLQLGYLRKAQHADLDARYEQVIGQLVVMIRNADRWCTL